MNSLGALFIFSSGDNWQGICSTVKESTNTEPSSLIVTDALSPTNPKHSPGCILDWISFLGPFRTSILNMDEETNVAL